MNKDSSKSTVKLVSIEKIVNMIPHRYPMLLIDKVEDLILGQSATGIKLSLIHISEPTRPY